MVFYVLLYDTYCVTVPRIWIDFERSTCQIPKKSKQLTQACIKQWSPCDDWDEITFRKSFGPYETYHNARSVEKALSDMSASDDGIVIQTQNENTSNKRLIKKRKFYGDTSSNEDEPKQSKITMPSHYLPATNVSYAPSQSIDESSTITNSCRFTTLNKKPPNTFDKVIEDWIYVSTLDISNCDQESYNEELQYSNTDMPQSVKNAKQERKKVGTAISHDNVTIRPRISSDETIYPSTSKSFREIDDMHGIISQNNNKNNNNREATSENQSTDLEHTSCCEKCRRGYSSKFATLERKLNRIIHFLENPRDIPNEIQQQIDLSLLPNFPLNTVEQVEIFNNQLEDNNVRRQFVEKMSQVGGETVSKNVRNIVSQTIGYEVAQAYTWTGQKKKLSLRKSNLSDAIIGINIWLHTFLFIVA